MARFLGSIAERRSPTVKAVFGIGLAGFLGGVAAQGPAQEPTADSDEGIATLERAYWMCDYLATRQVLDLGLAEACSTAAEMLKAHKFNGDFGAMLAWWRQNKGSAHQALADLGGTTPPEAAALSQR